MHKYNKYTWSCRMDNSGYELCLYNHRGFKFQFNLFVCILRVDINLYVNFFSDSYVKLDT